MGKIALYDHQSEALARMHNGCILCGSVGSGKSRTGLGYFFQQVGGSLDPFSPPTNPHDLYIITTARKRDEHEWDGELLPYMLSTDPEFTPWPIKVTVDSWNNIKKYQNVYGAFFIFDEDRVTGNGAWVKAFLRIANRNRWIILSATPGDRWEDYIPVFVANHFYKNKTELLNRHAVFNPWTKYRKIEKWVDVQRLAWCKRQVVVQMKYQSKHKGHHEYLEANYDKDLLKYIFKNRCDPYTGEPYQNASAFSAAIRRYTNCDDSRAQIILELCEDHPRLIIFYNFDYELEILRSLAYPIDGPIAEWNGHFHQPLPDTDSWVYLVQYNSASEAWNTTATDAMAFYSESYSYKTMVQSAGRIDRVNSPYPDLWYYHITSESPIDLGIREALENKRDFNENDWADGLFELD